LDFAEVVLGVESGGIVRGRVCKQEFLVSDLEIAVGTELALEQVELEGVFAGEEIPRLLQLTCGTVGADQECMELIGQEIRFRVGWELEDGIMREVDLDEGREGDEEGGVTRGQVGGLVQCGQLAGGQGIGVEAESPFSERLQRQGGGEESAFPELAGIGFLEVVEGGLVAGAGEELVGYGVLGLADEGVR
jgi:hypothetical protein